MKKLKVVKLKELGTIVGGGTPSTIVEEYYNGDISWITPKDLSGCNSKYISKGERSITQLGLDKSNAVLLPPKTILISSRAPIGYVAISTKELSTNQGFKSVIPNKNVVNTEYLYYLLSLNSDRLKNIGTGTTFKEVSKKVVEDFEMRIIEDVNEQEKIANLLSALDNKIELNNQMNKDLEELAQTLYTKWFVNFDFPNEEGKPYKSSGGEMIDSELGEIPAGWRVGEVDKLFNFISGSQPPKSEHIYEEKEGYIRFIQNRDYAGDNHITYIKNSDSNKICSKFDIMMDKYGDSGKVRYGIEGAYNVALAKIKPHKKYLTEYLRMYFSQNIVQDYLLKSSIASTRASLSYSNFSLLKCVLPSEDRILIEFDNNIKNILSLLLKNIEENQQLKETRDLLLPYLMSGKIDLGE